MALIAAQSRDWRAVYLPDWIPVEYQHRPVSGVSGSQQPKRSAAEVRYVAAHETGNDEIRR